MTAAKHEPAHGHGHGHAAKHAHARTPKEVPADVVAAAVRVAECNAALAEAQAVAKPLHEQLVAADEAATRASDDLRQAEAALLKAARAFMPPKEPAEAGAEEKGEGKEAGAKPA